MTRKGRIPKDPSVRVRTNKDPIPTTHLRFVKARQPALPKRMPDGRAWPARTRAWWRRWAKDPRSDRFDAAAWDDLLDTALVHAHLWSGDVKAAGELRLRVSKFGVTPEDRARLRITLEDGLEEVGSPTSEPAPTGARERYRGLRVVATTPPREGA